MEPTSLPDAPGTAAPEAPDNGHTRRNFIRGIAAAGVSTAAVAAVEGAGIGHYFADEAEAAGPSNAFAEFRAIAPSSADAFQVPEGYRADVIITYGDTFADDRGRTYAYGYNNDYLAYFPLPGTTDEGLIFVNHEYPEPFFQHGYKTANLAAPGVKTDKSVADVDLEKEATGNSIVHIAKNAEGVWKVVSPSRYNRRVYGGQVPGKPSPKLPFTGPRAGEAGIGTDEPADGTMGNCSGGITPWGTALSCEENYDGYGYTLPGSGDFMYGWDERANAVSTPEEYNAATLATPATATDAAQDVGTKKKYGWVVEHDPYDPDDVPRKHTALGRFRHENAAFRAEPGKRFVLYMGDDNAGQGVYKFVSDRAFVEGDRAGNRQIFEQGTLYIAKWYDTGRRQFNAIGDRVPKTPTSGVGQWIKVLPAELEDPRLLLSGFETAKTAARRAAGVTDPADPAYSGRFNRLVTPEGESVAVNEWDRFFATNRPEDLEVERDGSVVIAFTNSTAAPDLDAHGCVRRVVEAGNNPEATSFAWEDFAEGGPTGRGQGEEGFSSCDNLVIDKTDNVWVVTDISSSSLKGSRSARPYYDYHANNAIFMIPRTGPNRGVAFRFGNMPREAEGTGPYFTPDEQTLFVNVQHPGEETKNTPASRFGQPTTYSSYWPAGNKAIEQNPGEPRPSTVAITNVRTPAGAPVIPVPPPGKNPDGTPAPDRTDPRVRVLSSARQSLRALRGRGVMIRVRIDEPGTVRVTLSARLMSLRPKRRRRGKLQRLAGATFRVPQAGEYSIRIRPRAALRLRLKRETVLPAVLTIRATDRSGNVATRSKQLRFK